MHSSSGKLRVACVIDGSNLFVELRTRLLPTRLHYTQFGITIAKKFPPELGIWDYQSTTYVCSSPREAENPERFRQWRQFQEMLNKTDRLTLRLGRLEGPPGETREKGVDTIVVTTLLGGALKDSYDIGILVAADGDYASMIDDVREAGKRIFVAFFGDKKSHHCCRAANGFIDIAGFNFEKLRFYRQKPL
jgi:uncharacterized LabA/DUF88 family protein